MQNHSKVRMTDYIHYLKELRKRLLQSVLITAIVFTGFALFANKIYFLLALPLLNHLPNGNGLIATAVPAPFLIPFKSALFAALLITVPYWIFQLWTFIVPALYRHEKKMIWLLLISSFILFYLGIVFAYFIVLPLVFKFFIYIAPQGVEVKPDISQYFSFIIKIFFAFGLSFELPIATIILVWSNITTVEKLAKKRPYVIVAAFIFGMLLTPPDIISQILLAIPIWLLFELGLLLSKILIKKNSRNTINQRE